MNVLATGQLGVEAEPELQPEAEPEPAAEVEPARRLGLEVRAEDDGWVLTLSTDRPTEKSELVVLDARNLADGPIAYFRFEEAAGATTAADSSTAGANHDDDGSSDGTTVFVPPPANQAPTVSITSPSDGAPAPRAGSCPTRPGGGTAGYPGLWGVGIPAQDRLRGLRRDRPRGGGGRPRAAA